MTARIVVVGSCNLDIVVSGSALPRPGETVLAHSVDYTAGGKGLNQAIAAAHAGADVAMIGAVGDDAGAEAVRTSLVKAGVETGLLRTVSASTGTAIVTVDPDGENMISVVAGANSAFGSLSLADVAAIHHADALMLQLEVPLDLVKSAAAEAHAAGTLVALTPAPVQTLDDRLLSAVDILLCNRGEARAVTGVSDTAAALTALLSRVARVVITGGGGSTAWAGRVEGRGLVPARAVTTVDTTAAGDTFAGYLVQELARGGSLADAVEWANAAAAVSVTRHGSSSSIPTRAEVEA